MEQIKNKEEYKKEEIYITRTHKIHISMAHDYFKILDDACYKAKNLYNRTRTPRVGFFCCR